MITTDIAQVTVETEKAEMEQINVDKLMEQLDKSENTVRVLKESLINLEKLYYETCKELKELKGE